jgi:uncharacterized protein involved in exopolysaccharide biosynthesis
MDRSVVQNGGEVGWPELFAAVSAGKWIIASAAILMGLVCFGGAQFVSKTYHAIVMLSPATEVPGAGRSGASGAVAAQLSGLTSLIGLSANSGGGMKEISIATLQSELLVEKYIRDNDLLPILYARDWNQVEKKWRVPASKIPTVWIGGQYFLKDILKVVENSKTGLVTLTISWKDPRQAAQWANGLVAMTNNYLRSKAVAESERNIRFLGGEIAKTNVVVLQQSLYSLMEQEIEKQMLALGNDEYALKVVDPAVQPERPWAPKPMLWAVSGVLIGLFLSVAAVIAFADWGRGRTRAG